MAYKNHQPPVMQQCSAFITLTSWSSRTT